MKENIGILGTAANPITLGHTQLAQYILDNPIQKIDRVFITPCYQHYFEKELDSASNRLKMCDLAIEGMNNIEIFDFEIKNQLSGRSIDFLELLQKDPEYKNTNFYWIMGLDNANDIQKWYRSDDLLKMIPFLVVPRKGVMEQNPWYNSPPHKFITYDNREILEVSSQLVRQLIKEKNWEELKKFLNPKVIRYIKDNNLFL